MSTVVIDTNVLYSWAGLSPNRKLPAERIEKIAAEHRLFVASPTLAEFVTKHEDELAAMHKCLDIVFRNDVGYLSVGFVPLSQEPFQRIAQAKDIHGVSTDIGDIKDEKIRCEAGFLHAIFVSTVVAVSALVVREQSGEPRTDELAGGFQALVLAARDVSRDILYDALTKAYAVGDPGSVKNEYADLLEDNLLVMGINVMALAHGTSIGDLSEVDAATAREISTEARRDVRFGQRKRRVERSALRAFRKPKYKDLIEEFLDGFEKRALPAKYPAVLRQSLRHFLRSQLVDGAKMKKNDIMDMLLLCCVSQPDTLVLTLDGRFKKLLKEVHPPSFKFTQYVLGEGR